MYPFLIFIALPIAEIAGFVYVGDELGFWRTFGLILATGAVGFAIAQVQGISTLRKAGEAMNRGEPAVAESLHGLGLLIGAILLIIPGFITDAIGALLLIPPVRSLIGAAIIGKLIQSGAFRFTSFGGQGPGYHNPQDPFGNGAEQGQGADYRYYDDGKGPIIDGDYDVQEDPTQEDGQNPKLPPK